MKHQKDFIIRRPVGVVVWQPHGKSQWSDGVFILRRKQALIVKHDQREQHEKEAYDGGESHPDDAELPYQQLFV